MWSIWSLDSGVIFESGEDFGRGEPIRRYRLLWYTLKSAASTWSLALCFLSNEMHILSCKLLSPRCSTGIESTQPRTKISDTTNLFLPLFRLCQILRENEEAELHGCLSMLFTPGLLAKLVSCL